MRPYLITAKLMRPSNMKRFPTPGLNHCPFIQGNFNPQKTVEIGSKYTAWQ
jgi:hypothetical protein